MSLSQLAQYAVANNNTRPTKTPLNELTIEEARAKVAIKDGNKVAAEDGSQALTLTLGRYTVSLAAIAPKATRINAPKDQVEAFKVALQEAIDAGEFDEAIKEAQTKSIAKPVKTSEASESSEDSDNIGEVAGDDSSAEASEEAPEGVDLDALG